MDQLVLVSGNGMGQGDHWRGYVIVVVVPATAQTARDVPDFEMLCCLAADGKPRYHPPFFGEHEMRAAS